jgi:ketosteroid isomerase-like protein
MKTHMAPLVKKRTPVHLMSCGLVLAAAITVSGSAQSESTAIRAARSAQNRAIAAGDLDRVATFWTDDVTVRRALGAAVDGKQAARQALVPPATGTHLVYQRLMRDIEVSAQWPLAFETGQWEGHQDSAAGPVVIGGRYSAQWVKRNGQWLIRSEVFVALTCRGAGCESPAVP